MKFLVPYQYIKNKFLINNKPSAWLFYQLKYCISLFIIEIQLFPSLQQLHAQNGNLIINGSFEYSRGFSGDALVETNPDNWPSCSTSTPDLYKKYIFQSNNSILGSLTGNIFAGLRAHGANSGQFGQGGYGEINEYLNQKIARPLSKFTCYSFSIFLCSDLYAAGRGGYSSVKSDPLELKVWGSNTPCSKGKALFNSQPISSTFWEKFQVYFTVYDTSYQYLTLDIVWDTLYSKSNQYSPLVFLEDATLDSVAPAGIPIIDTVYFKGINKTTLKAIDGDSYEWSPENKLSNSYLQSTIIKNYSDTFSVNIGHKNSCPDFEIFKLKINCDSLYTDKLLKTYEVYYHTDKKTFLNPDSGYNYSWQPEGDLSAIHIKSPYIKGHGEDNYIVEITDEFNCAYQEKFNIIYNCDTIITSKVKLVLDTILVNHASVRLIPSLGTINGMWTPNDWLNCNSCQEPTANPLNSISYSVSLKDDYNCSHQENFKIGVELYVPNVITPNGDGFNDCFKIYGLPEGSLVSIYNKSGKLVFNSDTYNDSNCWEGKDLEGKQLETGTFWYSISHTGSGLLKKGFVFLKR